MTQDGAHPIPVPGAGTALIAVFVLYPIAGVIYYSFTDYSI